jgi:hypothetical protein
MSTEAYVAEPDLRYPLLTAALIFNPHKNVQSHGIWQWMPKHQVKCAREINLPLMRIRAKYAPDEV